MRPLHLLRYRLLVQMDGDIVQMAAGKSTNTMALTTLNGLRELDTHQNLNEIESMETPLFPQG